MAEFIKAYCSVSGQYFGIKVEGGKAVDFYDIPAEDAKRLASTADIRGLESAANLRECFVCGSRKAAGCGCAQSKYDCKSINGYRFQCLYCSKLKIFSKAEGSEGADDGEIGRVIRLAQGQEVVIAAVGDRSLEHIRVGLGWEENRSNKGANMDVDSSVVVVDSAGGERELVYFNRLEHPSGCVVHHGDNVVGGKLNAQSDDSEVIDVYLNRVPADRNKLFFVTNIYDCVRRRQSFADVRNMYIKLKDARTGRVLAEYTVTGDIRTSTGLVIGAAYRKDGSWRFLAIGEGRKVDNLIELADYCMKGFRNL